MSHSNYIFERLMMLNKQGFSDVFTTLHTSLDTLFPQSKPLNVMLDSQKQLQVPLVYTVEEQDRQIVAKIQPPYQSSQSQIADLLHDVKTSSLMTLQYDKYVRPNEEPLQELNAIFTFDTDKLLIQATSLIIDNSIDHKEKSAFYKHELDSLFSDLINKDVEQSALKLLSNQAVSQHQYNSTTGELEGFKMGPSQQIISFQKFNDEVPITDVEIDEILASIHVPQEDHPSSHTGSDTALLKQYLDSQQSYVKHARSEEEESKVYLDIYDILKKKHDQATLAKRQEEAKLSQALDLIKSQVVNEKNRFNPEELKGDFDEIDVIVQDSSALKEQIERQKSSQDTSVVALRQQPSMLSDDINSLSQQWYVNDSIDMKRFKEMIPNPAITWPFELDDFQKRAIYRLEQGNCVFVAAHTSAGKTVVAEYAIALAMKHMTKTIYTSPIKALSNQKFREFKEKFKEVGICTGDVSLDTNQACVIMTTEILQQMLYNDSDYLKDVEWVIFDEVHYINDPDRGSVWEEVIMKLPPHISIVMLSATVPNYKEFADWVGRTKQKKIYVQMTERRPVPLQHYIYYKEKLHLIKDENNKIYTSTIAKILKEEQQEGYKKYQEEKQKQGKPQKEQEESKFEKKKEIDFKEKALQAKEKSRKMVAMKATKNQGGSGGDGPNAQGRKNAKKFAKFYKSLITISREKLLPCVVFCFSRVNCEEIPNQLEPSLEFTTGEEKGEIKRFLKAKLQRLSESDRSLPQIQNIQALLVRGIGIHHAGMLPLVKEIVEILFADGLLKVVFATTTFAIGLNMPARSVFFTQTSIRKGEDMELLQTSEYLQMAGRAGRRGKDTTGFSIINLDRAFGKPPTLADFEQLLENKGTPLESKLKLSYSLTLNVMKSDDIQISDLLKTSFFENESEKERSKATIDASKLQIKIQKASHIDCIKGVPEQIFEYYSIYEKICQLNQNIVTIASKDLQPMCVIQVLSPYHIFEYMVILEPLKNGDEFPCIFIKNNYRAPIRYEEESQHPLKATGSQGSQHFEYVKVRARNIVRITDAYLKLNNSNPNLKDGQLQPKVLNDVLQQFGKLRDFQDWKLHNKCNQYVKERQVLLEDFAKLQCHKCELLNLHFSQVDKLKDWERQFSECKSKMGTGGQEKMADFKAKIQVLIHYKYLDYELNTLFKGKVASDILNTDKIITTELIFSGLLKELSNEECVALFSVLVNQIKSSKAQQCETGISQAFEKSLTFLQEEAIKLINVEKQFGVEDGEGDILQRLNFNFYEIIFEWAKQKPFVEIVKLNSIDEGSIIRMVNSVERVCQHVKAAARAIGDAVLAKRMDEASVLIKRDIVFTPSLYLE